MEAAKDNRYGHRDATMILVAYRHGLRASELCNLQWSQVDLKSATLHVRRVKSGTPSTHPLRGMKCGCCGNCRGIMAARSCSSQSAAHRLPLPALPGCWSELRKLLGLRSRFIRTCCVMLAVLP
jgi:hypothetical protein